MWHIISHILYVRVAKLHQYEMCHFRTMLYIWYIRHSHFITILVDIKNSQPLRISPLPGTLRVSHCEQLSLQFEKREPDAGLEPAAVGLKVQRSTDWANQAWWHQTVTQLIKTSSRGVLFVSCQHDIGNISDRSLLHSYCVTVATVYHVASYMAKWDPIKYFTFPVYLLHTSYVVFTLFHDGISTIIYSTSDLSLGKLLHSCWNSFLPVPWQCDEDVWKIYHWRKYAINGNRRKRMAIKQNTKV